LDIEFIIDTGFDGDLAVSGTIARRLPGQPSSFTKRALADGTVVVCPVYDLIMAVEGEIRNVKVLVLPGNPLLGTTFLMDSLLTIEVTEDGEVTAEPL
jgi:clan AA aspartic protease